MLELFDLEAVLPFIVESLIKLLSAVGLIVIAQVLRKGEKLLAGKKDKQEFKGQTFSEYVDRYIFNNGTKELEKMDTPENVQAKIDSYKDVAIDKVIERFLPPEKPEDTLFGDYTEKVEDLAVFGEVFDKAEYYREKFGLPLDMPIQDVYAEVAKNAKALKDELEAKRGEKDDEKKTEN